MGDGGRVGGDRLLQGELLEHLDELGDGTAAPLEARLLALMLQLNGASDFEARVVQQLMDFIYSYLSVTLERSNRLALHAAEASPSKRNVSTGARMSSVAAGSSTSLPAHVPAPSIATEVLGTEPAPILSHHGPARASRKSGELSLFPTSDVSPADLALSQDLLQSFRYVQPPPREAVLEYARSINNQALPLLPSAEPLSRRHRGGQPVCVVVPPNPVKDGPKDLKLMSEKWTLAVEESKLSPMQEVLIPILTNPGTSPQLIREVANLARKRCRD